MKLLSLNGAVLAFLVVGFVIPTGAVMIGSEDTVWSDHDVVITPHDDPNGAYATIDGDGNVSVDLATVGVNPNALTSIQNAFDVNNHGQQSVELWITHDEPDRVTFEVAEWGSIQGRGNNVTLGPGEAKAVSLRIDTTGVGSSEAPLLTTFRIHLASATEPSPTDPGTTTPAETPTTPEKTPSPTPTDHPTPTPSDPPLDDGEVEVEFDGDDSPRTPDDGVTVRELTIEELEDRERSTEVLPRPRAIADAEVRVRSAGEAATEPAEPDHKLRDRGITAIALADQDVILDGSQSIVGSTNAVDRDRKIVRIVDIDVPEDRRSQPGTVRISVAKSNLDDTDPARARIGRMTDEGWQLLNTRVARETETHLVLEARTRGFSPFAVFADSEIEYSWTFGNETIDGQEILTAFEEPGVHNATLSVTDSFGRSDNATVTILVNDVPGVTIEKPANLTSGEPTVLRANVTNEVGNATVSWILPDGSRKEGTEVEHTFHSGEQTVRATVEDEYGANGEAEATFVVASVGSSELSLTQIVDGLPQLLGLGTTVVIAVLLVPVLRRVLERNVPRVYGGIPSIRHLLQRRAPQIETLEEPVVDVRNRRFVIGSLRIEDHDGDLETVEIIVNDERENEVARKTIDLHGRTKYDSRDHVVVPKSRVYVREDGEYTITVRARDTENRWSRPSSTSIRSSNVSGA